MLRPKCRSIGGSFSQGEGYAFFFSPDMITDKVEPSRIVCAAATDDIGRVYRADEDETRKAIRQLLSLGATGRA